MEEGEWGDSWFERLNQYATESGITLHHFIVSSGIREMVEGTRVAKFFERIYASSFQYDADGAAKWPALAVNYTTKTQFLFRINKGSLDPSDNSVINRFVPKEDRPVPFENMVFFGDGDTDIPAFRLVKDLGGHSIAVFDPDKDGSEKKAHTLRTEERVNFFCEADYREKSSLDRVAKHILDKVQIDSQLAAFS